MGDSPRSRKELDTTERLTLYVLKEGRELPGDG